MEERLSKLLMKAIRSLPQREQDQIMVSLLQLRLPDPIGMIQRTPPKDIQHSLGELVSSVTGSRPGEAGRVMMLPVRLPEDLHERLRRWATEHDFSMAGVARGLIERFLDQQERSVNVEAKQQPNGPRNGAKGKKRARAARRPAGRAKRPTARG